jgi:hypothetical protein
MDLDIFIVDRGLRVLLVPMNNVALAWLSENTRRFARPAPHFDITKISDLDERGEPDGAQWWGHPEKGIHQVKGDGWRASAYPCLDVERRFVADIMRGAIEAGFRCGNVPINPEDGR